MTGCSTTTVKMMAGAPVREGRELLGGLMDWAGGRIGEEGIFVGGVGVWGLGD